MRPEAIIFDFDGVILDSVGVKTRAFAALARPYGEEAEERIVEYHEANGGISRYEKFAWFFHEVLGRKITPDESAAMGRRFEELAYSGVLAAPFIPGAREFLDAFHHEVPFFVASGTPTEELRRIVSERGLARYFREAHGSPTLKATIAGDILERFRFAPDDVLFVGDAMTDYRAAKECGLGFVGVAADGIGPFPEGTKVVKDLRELKPEI